MKTTDEFLVTENGLEQAQNLYDELLNIKRPAILKRLKETTDLGDPTENSEYDAAKSELAMLDTRINSLRLFIEKAKPVVKKNISSIVDIGSRVTLRLNGRLFTYTVVGAWEVKSEASVLSLTSPIGRAIHGQTIGYETMIDTPSGTLPVAIHAVI